jgi:hypothetical protein
MLSHDHLLFDRIDRSLGTFALFGDLAGLSREKIAQMFASHNFREVARDSLSAKAVWVSVDEWNCARYDKSSFSLRCRAKNVLDYDSCTIISNKMYLHASVARHMPSVYAYHFARTWPLAELKYPQDHDFAVIIRVAGTGYPRNHEVRIAANARDFARLVAHYRAKYLIDHTIVSEYFTDPYLFIPAGTTDLSRGLKFHLRMYFLARANGHGIFCDLFGLDKESQNKSVLPRAKILTAKLPYRREDYDNPLIHDTCACSTALFFPTHADRIKNADGRALDLPSVAAQLRTINAALRSLLRFSDPQHMNGPPARPYAESDHAFEVFALDIMIVRRYISGMLVDPCVVLLEVNDRVGYNTPPDALFDRMQDDFLRWVWSNGYAPCL